MAGRLARRQVDRGRRDSGRTARARAAPPIDTRLYSAVWKSVDLAFLVMAALSVGERLWKHAKVKQAGVGPDGANVTFEDAIADSVEAVNARIDSHVEDINKRLYDLEKAVFKHGDPSDDER